jgi:hypothetical protein
MYVQSYFEKTWVGSMAKKTRGDIVTGKRNRPRYDFSLWNHHEEIKKQEEITSNQSEVSSSLETLCISSITSLFSGL